MASEVNVDRLVKQTRQYEFADGLRDLQFALLFLAGGLIAWLATEPLWFAFVRGLAQTFGRWAAWASLLIVFLPALAALGMLGVMNLLRRRWLWRVSGVVKPSRLIVPRRVSVISVAIMLGSIALGFALRQFGWADDGFVLRMLWAGTGWSFGYTLIALGQSIDLARYIRLGAVGALASTALLFAPLTFGQAALALGLLWGVLLSVSGMTTLRTMLRSARDAHHAE
ncbi:MAG: hypothetical protein AB1817_22200 [Chloroflexota bacterium]